MSKLPLVSIITPTYNHEKYIGVCIESVLGQSYTNWEMLIIDDGSTDETKKEVAKYIAKDCRIKYYFQNNIGIYRLSDTYNKALNLSKGEYIAILEGDDYWIADKLSVQLEFMASNPECVLTYGLAESVSSEGSETYGIGPLIKKEKMSYYNNQPIGAIQNLLLFQNVIPALTMLIRKEPLLEIGGFKQPFDLPLVDLPTIFELSRKGSFKIIEQVLGYWRIYANQVTKTHTTRINDGFSKLALQEYYKSKDLGIISEDIDTKKLVDYYLKQTIIRYSSAGRYSLIRGQFKEARAYYLKSLRTGYFRLPLWKLRSLIGLKLSYLHLNVEWLAGIIGRKKYKIN